MTAMGRESDMLSDAAEVEEAVGDWYMLRVAPRQPSMGSCQPRLIDRGARLREADLTRGTSAPPQVRTPLRPEFVVEAVLRRRGYAAWVPVESFLVRRNRYREREKKVVVHPVVAGYVLVCLPSAPNWPRVLDFPMIRGVVGFGGAPAQVRSAGIDDLRSIEERSQARIYRRLVPTRHVYQVGDQVEVLDGPLDGFEVTIVGLTADAAAFEAMLFGRSVVGTIPLHKIGKIG